MTELRQRTPRVECPSFLAFVRSKPCCNCMAPPRSQAAHIRMPCLERGKEYTGKGQKADDRWTVPLCWECHLEQGEGPGAERGFWKRVELDPFAIAARLWAQFERRKKRTPEQKAKVSARARRILRKRKPMMGGIGEVEIVSDSPRQFRKPNRSKDPELYAYRWGKFRNQWPKGRKIKTRSGL